MTDASAQCCSAAAISRHSLRLALRGHTLPHACASTAPAPGVALTSPRAATSRVGLLTLRISRSLRIQLANGRGLVLPTPRTEQTAFSTRRIAKALEDSCRHAT